MKSLLPINIPNCRILPGKYVIAGPCSAESAAVLESCAGRIAGEHLAGAIRAGVWKPRTRPGGFQGMGESALPWLRRAAVKTGLPIGTEVATPAHLEQAVSAGVDFIWIGARTAGDPFAIQALAESIADKASDMTVLVKNPMNPDVELWIGALQRLYKAGVRRLGAIHRGFSVHHLGSYRNAPLWQIPLQLHMRYPHLPILHDPSHTGGDRSLIAPLSQAAMDLGFDGLMIECHVDPAVAMSDGGQQVTPAELKEILTSLKVRANDSADSNISAIRLQIDEIDNELISLLSRRLLLTDEIGRCKRIADMPVLQPDRYKRLLTTLLKAGTDAGLDAGFLSRILEEIHEESVRRQLQIINAPSRGGKER